jgi:hypothetical protein
MDNDSSLCLIAQDNAYEELALAAVRRRAPAVHLLDRISCERSCTHKSLFLSHIIDAAIAGELQPDVLEWVRQRAEMRLVIRAIMTANLRVFDWLLTKKPDIFSWEYYAFWGLIPGPQAAAFVAVHSWFAARVDVQDLALYAHDSKNPHHCFTRNSISFLLSLEPHPALERVMLRFVITRRLWGYLSLFASRPRLVREFCIENSGLLLRRLESRKGKRRNRLAGLRKFVQRFLSPSDYASAGLAVPRPH